MLAQSAAVAAIILMLLVAALMGETTYLAPYKRTLLVQHGMVISAFLLLVWVNLVWLLYSVRRLAGLKHTGRKLHHLDQQLGTPDTVLADLSARLEEEGP